VRKRVIRHLSEVGLLSHEDYLENPRFVPLILAISIPVITTSHSLSPISFNRYTVIMSYDFLTLIRLCDEKVIREYIGLTVFLVFTLIPLALTCTPKVFSILCYYYRIATACQTNPILTSVPFDFLSKALVLLP
jgi:hypothetical protein